jgi:hypothetical protein
VTELQFEKPPGLGAFLADTIVDPPKRRYRVDPVAWAKSKNIELWSKQKEIMQSVVDNANTSVGSCHGIGKSFTAALTSCWWLDTHPVGDSFVLTTAPTDKQVKAILWREINKFHAMYGLAGRTNLSEWYIGKELVAFGRKPSDYDPTAFQGIHARYLLVVIDEACGIPKDLWVAASTLATSANSRILAIGNPDDEFSEFKAKSISKFWHHIKIGYHDTPNFTGEPISPRLKEMLISEEWVMERRDDWGEGSALFTSKCLGEFPHGTSPFTVIPITMIEMCRVGTGNADQQAIAAENAPLSPPQSIVRVEAGLDVAAGGDRTVLWLRRGNVAMAEFSFRESDPIKSAGAICLKLKEWGVTVVKMDPIGVGWGLMGTLRDKSSHHNPRGECAHDAQIIGVNFAEKPERDSDQKKYLNKRAQCWWYGRELSRTQSWDLSRISASTMQELSTPQYEVLDSNGKIKIQKKEEVIDVLGRSPDSADALLLAFWEASFEAQMADHNVAAQSLTGGVQPGNWAFGRSMTGSGPQGAQMGGPIVAADTPLVDGRVYGADFDR